MSAYTQVVLVFDLWYIYPYVGGEIPISCVPTPCSQCRYLTATLTGVIGVGLSLSLYSKMHLPPEGHHPILVYFGEGSQDADQCG